MKVVRSAVVSLGLIACLGSCLRHRLDTEPIEVKPIHVTVDVNVKVQRELQEFFDFEKAVEPGPEQAPPATPADPKPDRKE
jgi:hypothetical protein